MSTRRDRTFTVSTFRNPSGETVFRVNGWEGAKRIRENYREEESARARRNSLENAWLGNTQTALRAVEFPPEFQRVCTAAFAINPDPAALLAAVRHWNSPGRKATADRPDVPRLDEAVRQFVEWLASPGCQLRERTKTSLKSRVQLFAGTAGNVPLADLTSDGIAALLEARWPHPITQDTVRRRISRFLAWCAARPRRWLASNPANGKLIVIEKPHLGVPAVLTRRQTLRVLAAARRCENGRFLPWVVRQLFCGLRPTEAVRLRAVNTADGELHLDAHETKTARPRTVHLDPVAVAWLKAAGNVVVGPEANQRTWQRFVRRTGLQGWTRDILRHTAVSMKFRQTGSYGRTAEWAGNSEAIIKRHYQGRVSTAEAAAFWALHPDRKVRQKMARATLAPVIELRQAA